MGFSLLDRIEELVPGTRITGVKTPDLKEEYLQDHFPLFPVLPGVLMLESMYQAAAWLLRYDDAFADSMVLLKEAKTVKYAGFVQPGEELRVTADLLKRENQTAWFKAKGLVKGEVAVSGRLVLEHFNLADTNPAHDMTDEYIRRSLKQDFEILYSPQTSVSA